MASYGLKAVNEPLGEAVSQLSLDSLRDHENLPYSLNFSRVGCICQEVFTLQPTVSGKLMTYQLLLPVQPTEDIICDIMTIQKFYCSSTLICPIRKTYRSIF